MEAPANSDDQVGVRFPEQGQLRVEGITFNLGGELIDPGRITVRTEVWPHWLTIAGEELAAAGSARESNPGRDSSLESDLAILREYRKAMMSICTTAFTLEAFTNAVESRCPKFETRNRSRQANLGYRRQSASARCHQVWTHAFCMSNTNSAATKTTLNQIFALRNEAVHPPAKFFEPVMHQAFRMGFERRFAIYTVENAEAAYKTSVDALIHLLERPRGDNANWLEWCAIMLQRPELA
ncbi:hypothetical protein [Arthrobacter cheniae]|uniref:hypothetical protein n=1 Tax=Arthrobacter cheniae TaxID=1258888 RepID=UPI0011C468E3|nr:hypothetical protein [Arthrobacter cheniae]